jgi:hypothetical protein
VKVHLPHLDVAAALRAAADGRWTAAEVAMDGPRAAPAVLQGRKPEPVQPGLPLGRPVGPAPRARSLMPGRLPRRRPLASQAKAVQPVPHGPRMGSEVPGDLTERPGLLNHPVVEIVLQTRKAKPGRLLGEALIGSTAPVPGGHHRLRRPLIAA